MIQGLASVLIPAYNHARYVGEAIESVLNQTYPQIELLICDDASTDGTAAVIGSYAEKHADRIKYIPHSENRGAARRWTELAQLARGEFIIPFASDDVLPTDAVERRVSFLLQDPDLDLVFTDFDLMIGDKIIKGAEKLQYVPHFAKYFNVDFARLWDELIPFNFIPGGTVAIRVGRISQADLAQDERVPGHSDYDFWLNVTYRRKCIYVPESTWIYRWHATNYSSPTNPVNTQFMVYSELIYALAKQLTRRNLTPVERFRLTAGINSHSSALGRLIKGENAPRVGRGKGQA